MPRLEPPKPEPRSARRQAPASGNYDIEVTASNAAGEGPSVKTSLWIGDDLPTAPKNVTASKGDNKVTVSWTAPSTTSHGGFLNQAALRYKVTRFPDMKVVPTTWQRFPSLTRTSACPSSHTGMR